MTDIHIYPRAEAELTTPEAREARIAAWEGTTGHHLPTDYRRFMVSYGGGLPFPNDIPVGDTALTAALGDDIAVLFEIFDWPQVEAHHRGEVHLTATPRDVLLICDLEFNAYLALSLRSEDAGTIHLWRASGQVWDQPGNTRADMLPFARSFSDVLRMVVELGDSDVGRSTWENGAMHRHARLIEL